MNKQIGQIYGAVEAGGTKFVCLIGEGPDRILAEMRIPTSTPDQTIEKVIKFFKHSAIDRLSAIGVASFGPVDVSQKSPTYGFITNTPKPGWSHYDIVGVLSNEFDVPIGFDTDVNGAAYGEYVWGAGRGLRTILYLTVGTGIGGGAVVERNIVHGLLHPEMGHIRIPHDRLNDPFEGICPYHHDCLEGLASGPAIAERWGNHAQELPTNHPAWKLEAKYLAFALANYSLVISPQKIILGGGVMSQEFLFDLIRIEYKQILNNYIQMPETTDELNAYIVPPGLGKRSGVLGAMALAIDKFGDG